MARTRILGTSATVATVLALALAGVSSAEPGTHSKLTAVRGQGEGFVSVAPTARDHGTFQTQNEINIHGALPETTFLVQRAVDFVPNGICTIEPGPPFGWITDATITTSAGGAGTAHVARSAPPPSGTQFDLIFRVISLDGTQLLMSDCLTVTVK